MAYVVASLGLNELRTRVLFWMAPDVFGSRKYTFQWRHNGHDGVLNHQPHYSCLLNRLFGRRSKKTSKLRRHWPLCGEFTGDRWIPRTNGQQRGKCFYLMTSSCMGVMLHYGICLLFNRELWGLAFLHWCRNGAGHIDGLVQERRNSSALAMELHLSCTNPSISANTLTSFRPGDANMH